jgi:hypothetical protein
LPVIDNSSSIYSFTYTVDPMEATKLTVARLSRTTQFQSRLRAGAFVTLIGIALGITKRDVGFYFFAASGLAYVLLALTAPRRAVRRLAKGTASLGGGRTVSVLDEGLLIEGESDVVLHRWGGISGTSKNVSAVYVMRGSRSILAIPSRAFALDHADLSTFERLVSSRGQFHPG